MGLVCADELIAILEAVYRNEADDEAWLAGVVERVRPHLDAGGGIAGFLYDARDGVRIEATVECDAAPFVDIARAVGEALGPAAAAALFLGPSGFGPLSQLPATSEVLTSDLAFGTFAALGYADLVALRASTTEGRGALLVAPSRETLDLSPEALVLWRRVARHLGAALRLRRRERATRAALRAAVDRADLRASDVVPSSAGEPVRSVSDVVPSGLSVSSASMGDMDEDAPSSGPPSLPPLDPPSVVWDGLVAGRWTLVDQFEHEGRCFLVARRSDTPPPARAELSPREVQIARLAALGHSNKLIAYEMGLSISTVALHLSRASRKLGATSRVALIRAVKQIDTSPPPSAATEPPSSSTQPRGAAEGAGARVERGPRGNG